MKIIIKILACLMVLLITTTLQAQTTTTSSSKSSTTTSIHSDSDGGNSTYSYSHSTNEKYNNQSSNVSVSISNSDDSYSFSARFPSKKHKEIKDILTKEMSSKNYIVSKGKDSWHSYSNGKKVYQVSLSNKKLTMILDKKIASSSLAKKIKDFGLTLRTVIAGNQNETRREAERLQRKADRLRRDAERMQHEADRIQREAQRHVTASSRQYVNDALKIADEAKRLVNEASYLNKKATHKGAISSDVKQLLGDSKTTYNATTSSFYWTWPDAQSELLVALKKENLIDPRDNIVFVKDATGIHVNGIHLSKNKAAKYSSILRKNKITKTHYFTFYKIDKHIVLLNDNADIKGFIDEAVSENILESANKKVKLELNGNSAYKNGFQVSTDILRQLNNILLKNNIIPSPGKMFEIMQPKNYKLGYSLGRKSHLGTWVMEN